MTFSIDDWVLFEKTIGLNHIYFEDYDYEDIKNQNKEDYCFSAKEIGDSRIYTLSFDFSFSKTNSIIDKFEELKYQILVAFNNDEPIALDKGYRISPFGEIYKFVRNDGDLDRSYEKFDRMAVTANRKALTDLTNELKGNLSKDANISPVLPLTSLNNRPQEFLKEKDYESGIVCLIDPETRAPHVYYSYRDAAKVIADEIYKKYKIIQNEEDLEKYRRNIRRAVQSGKGSVEGFWVVGIGKYKKDELKKSIEIRSKLNDVYSKFFYGMFAPPIFIENFVDLDTDIKKEIICCSVAAFGLVGLKSMKYIKTIEEFNKYVDVGVDYTINFYPNIDKLNIKHYCDVLRPIFFKRILKEEFIDKMSDEYLKILDKFNCHPPKSWIILTMNSYYINPSKTANFDEF